MKKNITLIIMLTTLINIFSQGVGIGTKTPTHKLHVNGQVRIDTLISGASTDSIVTASPTTGVLGRVSISKLLNGNTTNSFVVANGIITNTTNGVSATLTPSAGTITTKFLGFDASGNLVTDTAATGNLYTADGTLTGNRVVTQGANTITFSGSSVNSFSVDDSTISINASNNRMGILTKSPGEVLDVRGNSLFGIGDVSDHYIGFRGLTGDGPGTYDHTFIGNRLYNGNDNSELFIYQGNDFATNIDRIRLGSGEIRFQTLNANLSGSFGTVASSSNLVDRMFIASGGNVGIGNTTPTDKLHVSGTARIETMNSASATDSIVYADATGVLKRGSQKGKVLNYVAIDDPALVNSSFSSTGPNDLISYSYTPVSSSSKIIVEYQNQNYSMNGGVGSSAIDDWQSMLVFGSITTTINYYSPNSTYGTLTSSTDARTSSLLPIKGVYTNNGTSSITIKVQIKRLGSDDTISFPALLNSANSGTLNGTLTIVEIGN